MQPVADQIYFREFDPAGNDSLTKIAARIAPGTQVLDLGCGPGVLGARLGEKGCVVDGVEGNPEAAALAAARLHRVVVADLEAEPVAAHLGAERYDYIVCADVLEHLRRPQALLEQLRALLAANGRILLSIPNVAYGGLVGALINGEFRYRTEGLLDATHLRFFTRESLRALVSSCGLQITHDDVVALPIDQSEFRSDDVESLPPAVLRTLLGRPDALTYQFVVELAAEGAGVVAAEPARVKAPAFTYVAQLFYRGAQPFDATHVVSAQGELGVERQSLRLAIPPQSEELAALRFDPSNRPGYLRLYSLELRDHDGTSVWRFDGSTPEPTPAHQLRFVREGEEGCLLVCEGDDSSWELPVPRDALVRVGRAGGTLEAELSWPMAHDSRILLRRLFGGPGAAEPSELLRLEEELRAQRHLNDELTAQLQSAQETIARINGSLTFRLLRPLYALSRRLRGAS